MDEIKRLVLGEQSQEDEVVSLSLRPHQLSEFIGQKDIVAALKIAMAAAKKRSEPLEHILFSGPPGLGKTSLAHIMANEMNRRITITSGPAIERAGDFIGILTNLEQGDILFIDEIHRLSKTVEEFLYPAMESFKIDFVVDKGPYAKTINFNLKPFTLIGATTRSGLLATPLRDRFGIFHHLEFYQQEDLALILKSSAVKLGVEVDAPAADEIARRSRGTPRVANRLLRRCRDYAQVKAGKNHIDLNIVLDCMKALRIDEYGLDDLDRRLLQVIKTHYQGGPVGIEALSATLNEEVDTLVDVIEPYLLKTGFLRRTSRGRELTELSLKHVAS
ncbi:MAG: Holliday junction branch migration DNA helicase RuvB [Candidatus Omnitrophica bacterium]|nr:Holliday junction branch migration DNA helicase RuvB [Candidatus Omnitrophota bacterium]